VRFDVPTTMSKRGLLYIQDGGSAIPQNIRSCSPVDIRQRCTR